MDPLTTLTGFPQFRTGFVAGAWLLVLVVAVGWSSRSRRHGLRSPWGLAGPAWVVGSLLALDEWGGFHGSPRVPDRLIVALVVLFLGAELASRTPNPKFIGVLLAFPGALVLASALTPDRPGWVGPLVVVATTFGAPCAADVDRRAARLGLGPVLWLITVLGVYVTVPDTEIIRPLVGVAVPLAVSGWPLRAARLGAGGAAAGIGLLLWVASFEGLGRPGSIVGSAGALGLLLVEPLGRKVVHRRFRVWTRRWPVGRFEVAFVATQVVVVGYATRVAGFAQDAGPATWLLIPGLLAGAAVGGMLGLSKRLRPERAWFGPRRNRASSRRAHPSASRRR